MERFVLLKHETPPDSERATHWDFMLERSGALRTWALPRQPEGAVTMPAEALADHRLEYLDYEGPISGGRGSVARCDAGTFQLIDEEPDRIVADLAGRILKGRVTLVRLGPDGHSWRFEFVPNC